MTRQRVCVGVTTSGARCYDPVAQVTLACALGHQLEDQPLCRLCVNRTTAGLGHCPVCVNAGAGRTPLRVETTETL